MLHWFKKTCGSAGTHDELTNQDTPALHTANTIWKKWINRTSSAQVINAVATIGSIGFVVKIVYAAKDILVAGAYGTSQTLDAYLLAYVFINFLISITARPFHAALIPVYIDVREQEGQDAANRLFRSITGWACAILTGIALFVVLLSPVILRFLASGFTEDTMQFAQLLFVSMLPVIIFQGLATIWGAMLNANNRFALVALAPVLTPVSMSVLIVFFAAEWGVFSLVAGLLLGAVLELILLALTIKKLGFPLLPALSGKISSRKQVLVQYLPIVVSAIMMSSTNVVDQAMATPLGEGSVSALNYGYKLIALILNTGAIALGTAILPHFARIVSQQDWHRMIRSTQKYSLAVIIATLPIMLALLLGSETIIRLVFERGAFTASDTQIVSQVQSVYVLLIPIYLVNIIVARIVNSVKINQILVRAAVINIILNILLNWLFIQLIGLPGIALSTVFVYLVSLLYIYRHVMKHLHHRQAKGMTLDESLA